MKYFIGFFVIYWTLACSPGMKPTEPNQNSRKSYKINTIAFYNVENLFDTIDDPEIYDESSPIMKLPKNQQGEVYKKKVTNLAKVISEIGAAKAKNPPAIVGLAEIENRLVLEDLVNNPYLKDKNYGIIHYDSPDFRGIDVALLYQKKLFRPISSSPHEVVIYDTDHPDKRYYTRDVLLATGILDRDTLHFLVNHWPSRYGGEKRSRPHREKAAAVDKRLTDSLLGLDPYAKIIIMGDMNDDPINTSVKKVLGAKAERDSVGKNDLYNPMENMLTEKGLGTLGYRDSWNLFDQMIMTKALLKRDYSSYRYYKAGLYNPKYLITQHGRYQGYPFRSFASGEFTGGYSDHFPVYLYLVKEVKEIED